MVEETRESSEERRYGEEGEARTVCNSGHVSLGINTFVKIYWCACPSMCEGAGLDYVTVKT